MSTVKLGDVAIESKEVYKGDKTGYPIVGLEHIIPEEVALSNWSVDTENTFTKMFRKDDILFGRRRAYLKKAAIAPFDGICSGDITVIRAKSDKLIPTLLPFVIQNDDFFEYAVGKSAGSLSPRVKWEHLKNYEFKLPSLEKQKELADLLWAINDSRRAYQELLRETDELIKSQFIDMFGDVINNDRGWLYKYLPEVTEIILGSTPRTNVEEYWNGDIKWITPAELTDETFFVEDTERHITKAGVKNTKLTLMPVGTVLFSTRAPIGKTGITSSEMYCNQGFKNFICSSSLEPVYLYCLLKFNKEHFISMGSGTTFKELSRKVVETFQISVPPIELQMEFKELYLQSEKSKFELKQAIEGVDNLIRSLIQQELK